MPMTMRLCLALLASLSLPLHATERVEIWSYNLSPPFHLSDGQGLSSALVDLLNQHAANDGHLDFFLHELPRKRLDLNLQRGRPGIVLWATPRFFEPASVEGMRWSAPLLLDRQDVISRRDAPVEYDGPQSLLGLRLGGVLGHRYPELDEQIAAGRIHREDVQSDLQNLEKLLAGRLDVVLMPRSAWLYYSQNGVDAEQLYLSSRPLYPIERRLLCTSALPAATCDALQQQVGELPQYREWQALIGRYGLEPISLKP